MRTPLLLIVLCKIAYSYGISDIRGKAVWDTLATVNPRGLFIPCQPNETIHVDASIYLITMSDYDHTRGTMRLGYWSSLSWKVPKMKWDPKKFNNVSSIRIAASEVWVPDVVPYKHTDSYPVTEVKLVLHSDGNHMWTPHVITTIICKDILDGPRFPRDHKKCRLKLGSWTYDGNVMNLRLPKTENTPTDLIISLNSKPLLSSGWKFVNASSSHKEKKYPCCPESFPEINVDIIIRRNDVYYELAVTAPGVITGLLVSLLYLVAPCSPARIVSQSVCLLILVFVAVTDLRLMGSSVVKAPAALYFIAAMVLNLIALFWSIVIGLVWSQVPPRSLANRGLLDSVLDRLQLICLLPAAVVEDAETEALSSQGNDLPKRNPMGLSTRQRLLLVLNRLMCLVNLILFTVLFVHFKL